MEITKPATTMLTVKGRHSGKSSAQPTLVDGWLQFEGKNTVHIGGIVRGGLLRHHLPPPLPALARYNIDTPFQVPAELLGPGVSPTVTCRRQGTTLRFDDPRCLPFWAEVTLPSLAPPSGHVVVVPAVGPVRCEQVAGECMAFLADLRRLVGSEIEITANVYPTVAFSEYGRGAQYNDRASTMMGHRVKGTVVYYTEEGVEYQPHEGGDEGVISIYGYPLQAALDLKARFQ